MLVFKKKRYLYFEVESRIIDLIILLLLITSFIGHVRKKYINTVILLLIKDINFHHMSLKG